MNVTYETEELRTPVANRSQTDLADEKIAYPSCIGSFRLNDH